MASAPAETIVVPDIQIKDIGYCDYSTAWELQKEMHVKRIKGEIGDTLILTEHEPVYTLGKNADGSHVLDKYTSNVKVYRVERGGDVTFHGPGQLVGYPILDLQCYRPSISWYMRTLEELIIQTLAEFGLYASRKDKFTGVWVGDEKIASLGVRVSRWVTMHGFALNVNTDLSYYDGIIPCGISEYGVTSMKEQLRRPVSMAKVKQTMVNILLNHFAGIFKNP